MNAQQVSELITARKAYLAEDTTRMVRRPANVSRAAWRMENPIETISRDATDPAGRKVSLGFDVGMDLLVWYPRGDGAKVVERIDLMASDAAARLAKFELI